MAGSKTFLKQIWFTVILLNPPSHPFASYGFMISEETFNGIKYKDIQNTVQYPKYALFGLARINSGFQGNFDFNIDNDMIVSMSNRLPNFAITMSFVIIGAKTNSTCSNCPGEQYMYYDQCYFGCPAGTFKYYYRSGGIACHKCSLKLKQTLEQFGNGCVCLQGYQMTNGVCVSAATTVPAIPSTIPRNPTSPSDLTNVVTPPKNNPEGTDDPALIVTDEKTCSLFPNAFWSGS